METLGKKGQEVIHGTNRIEIDVTNGIAVSVGVRVGLNDVDEDGVARVQSVLRVVVVEERSGRIQTWTIF